jgi:putative membrane protein
MNGWWFFWIALIVLVILFVRWLPTEGRGHEALRESPIEILKRRYAEGEIEKEEYERKLADLRH